jgi:hypothetical protein
MNRPSDEPKFRTEYVLSSEDKLRRFGQGAWLDEPDFCEWDHGFVRCVIRRHFEFGSLNGYIGVQPGHPWYERDYDELEVRVHGGLNCSDSDWRFREGHEANKNPSPTDKPLWWLGFDCSHLGFDLVPQLAQIAASFRENNRVYRDFRYVRDQVNSLAEQAMEALKS